MGKYFGRTLYAKPSVGHVDPGKGLRPNSVLR